MPLRFSRRILLLIGPVIAVLAASSLFSLLALIRLAEGVTELTEDQLPLIQQVTRLTFNQQEQTRQIERILRLRPIDLEDGTESLRRGFDDRAEQIRRDLLAARQLVEQSAGTASDTLRDEMARIGNKLTAMRLQNHALRQRVEVLLDLLEAGNLEQADRQRLDIEKAAAALEQTTEASLLRIEAIVTTHSARARIAERRAISWTGALLALGLAAGGLIGVWGVRSLVAAKDRERRFSALAAVGEFSTAVAHGLRNPLAGIRAAAQLAAQDVADGVSATESLESIREEADRLEQRIGSLLELARPFHAERKRQDLRPVLETVQKTLADVARQEDIEIQVELPSEPVVRRIDGDYLEDALLELAANALHAMPDGGTLILGLHTQGRGVRLTVQDTGTGIPEGARPRIFDLFFSTRDGGSGMGLAGVRQIVEAHGGTIQALETGPGGTLFAIDLP